MFSVHLHFVKLLYFVKLTLIVDDHLQVLLVLKGPLDLAVFKEDPDSQVRLVQEVLPVSLDLKELRDYQEVQVVLVHLVHLDQMGLRDLLASQVGLEDLVQQVRSILGISKNSLFSFV